ncbi:MAG: hypothetical protein RLO17_09090 [Cyclobacteriaceae bacterium]
MKQNIILFILGVCLFQVGCNTEKSSSSGVSTQPVYQDVPFIQDYSIKYYKTDATGALKASYMDRNGVIQTLSEDGLLRTHDGQFLYPGELITDRTYRPLTDKNITNLITIDDQFVYLDDEAVLSNAWAGKLFIRHEMKDATLFAGSPDFQFLISNGKKLKYLTDNSIAWEGNYEEEVQDITYASGAFYILGEKSISKFDTGAKKVEKLFDGNDLTAFEITTSEIVVGTEDGYLTLDLSGKQKGELQQKLPWTEITAITSIDGTLWFGSTKGAFKLRKDSKFDYYYGERWIPGNVVISISEATDGSVLILTDEGLGQIVFEEMTLHEKAMFFEKQVRDRHIRVGFNASLVDMEKGNVDSGRLSDSDNDGLWTAMYLGGEIFRYAVTGSEEALQNCRESLDAMERLYSINPVPGFPSRSFERSGYIERLHDPDRWQHSEDPEWDWKATTSSDEAIGHIFAFGAMAELIDDEDLKSRAITLIDTLMSHIVKNDMYLVDYDGKPTTWGRWNPEYVNARPEMVGDRKINASNIVAMLQTAYYFTGKEKYKDKAFELMTEDGYLDNLMWPMEKVGPAPDDADDWSKMLSEGWNHSDDEMYYMGYWGLYRYAFNDSLKQMFKEAIIDHWEIERPEKEGAWNIMTALTGTEEFDLEEGIWYLQQHPMDLITWDIANSHRKDIEFMEENFRGQTITEVLPPDERPIQRHNGNMFRLDRVGRSGTSEYSAGDIWLLPYWIGRYLGVISEPQD